MLPKLPNINHTNNFSTRRVRDSSIKSEKESPSVESLPKLGIAERFSRESLKDQSISPLGGISSKLKCFSSSQSLPSLMKTTNSSAFTSYESGLSELSEPTKEGFVRPGGSQPPNDVSFPRLGYRLGSPSPLSISDFSSLTSRADSPIDINFLKFENFGLTLELSEKDLKVVLEFLLENEDDSPDETTQKCKDLLATYDKFIDYDLSKLRLIQSSLNLSDKKLIGFSFYLLYSILDECAYNLEDFNAVFLKLNKEDLGAYYDFQVQILKMDYANKLLAGGML